MMKAIAPLRDPAFRVLWLGRCASYLGDGMMPVAVPFGVLYVGGGLSDIGLVLGTFAVARLIAVVPAGTVVDRWGRRRTILMSDGLQALAYGLMSVALAYRWGSIIPLMVGSVVAGVASSLFLPLIGALTADLVVDEGRQAANALISGARYSLGALAAALSGLLVAIGSPALPYAFNAMTFVASFLLMRQLPSLAGAAAGPSWLSNFRAGLIMFRDHRWYASTCVSHGVYGLLFAPFLVGGPAALGAAGWATVAVAGTLGAFIGAIVGAQFRAKRPLQTSAWLLMTGCLPLLFLGGIGSVVTVSLGYGVGMAGQAITNDLWQTGVQRNVPSDQLGRLAAYEWVISLGLAPIGLVTAGPIMNRFGQSHILFLSAGGILITAILTAINPRLRDRESLSRVGRPIQTI